MEIIIKKEINNLIKKLNEIANNLIWENTDDDLSKLIDLVLEIDKKFNTDFISKYIDNTFIEREILLYMI